MATRNWRKAGGADALARELAKGSGDGSDLLFGGGNLRDTVSLRLADVVPNPDQPPRHFDEDELQQLAVSLQAVGQLSPILVKPHPDEPRRYLLVAGERRWRAADLAGLGTIAAHILDKDADLDRIALIENLQRVNLSPVEEAEGIQRLVERHGYAQEQAGALLGRSRTEVNTTLTLLRLHPSIRKACVTSHTALPKALLLAIARMDTPHQLAAWERAKAGDLTTRDARAARRSGADAAADGEAASAARSAAACPAPARFIAALPKLQKGLESGLAAVEAGRHALNGKEEEHLRELRRRLAFYAATIDRILEEQGGGGRADRRKLHVPAGRQPCATCSPSRNPRHPPPGSLRRQLGCGADADGIPSPARHHRGAAGERWRVRTRPSDPHASLSKRNGRASCPSVRPVIGVREHPVRRWIEYGS
jgi:ParB family chromosome partitioning protein